MGKMSECSGRRHRGLRVEQRANAWPLISVYVVLLKSEEVVKR
jgi:hypothetical protein